MSVLSQSKPLGFPITWLATVPDSEGAIVLFDYMAGPKNFANLARIEPDGSVLWRTGPPDQSGPDAFVSASLRGGRLRASTWSGARVSVDLSTGVILDSTFVK